MERLPLYVNPIPLDLAFNAPRENLKLIAAAVAEGLKRAPDVPPVEQLFVFPELTLTGFVTKDPEGFSLAEPHRHVSDLCAIARDNRTGIIAGLPESNPSDPKKPFNVSVLIGPDGKIAAFYRKQHLFTLGRAPETGCYSAGAGGVAVLYRGWKIALAICFDIRFPAFLHQYARAEVDLIVVSSCWVGGPHKTYQYRTINSAHAILTQSYVAAVNRKGKDPFFEYDGTAYVFSPFGEDLYAGKPCALDGAQLDECRTLSVRPADRNEYPVRVVD